MDIGSETERELRVRQILGAAPLYPWSIRAFAAADRDSLDGLPRSPNSNRIARWTSLPVTMRGVYNTGFPFGINDGPVWAGRGATASFSGGFASRYRWLSMQFEPIVFAAQNQAFTTQPTGRAGAGAYASQFNPFIDLPQRFGNTAYTRFDFGQSTLRLDAGPVAAELSTANQFWGPALENPIILGNNAAGFPHAMVGTSHPLNVGIGRLHTRVVWGRLSQSAASPQEGFGSVRFMSGFIAELIPRGVPGLELGATRFFHTPWPQNGLLHAPFSRPFEAVFKIAFASATNRTGNDSLDNQLASVFARWVFPESGLELFAEYGKEDHNRDVRDLLGEPDHAAAFLLGGQHAWRSNPSRTFVVRAEYLNTRLSHLDQTRQEAAWYIHPGGIAQGHTQLGQLLGSAGGFGGGAGLLALDRVDSTGRWTIRWTRLMRAERRIGGIAGLPAADDADVMHALGLERHVYRGRIEALFIANGVYEFNRDFLRDEFNLNTVVEIRARW